MKNSELKQTLSALGFDKANVGCHCGSESYSFYSCEPKKKDVKIHVYVGKENWKISKINMGETISVGCGVESLKQKIKELF